MCEGVTVVRRCHSPQGAVKVVRNLFQLMERYDGHGGDVMGCLKIVMIMEEVDKGLGRRDSCGRCERN